MPISLLTKAEIELKYPWMNTENVAMASDGMERFVLYIYIYILFKNSKVLCHRVQETLDTIKQDALL